MSGMMTYTVVKPSSPEELGTLLAHAAATGTPVSFEAMSIVEDLNETGPREFTVLVDVMHIRPAVMFEVTNQNTRGAFRIHIPTKGSTVFTIFG